MGKKKQNENTYATMPEDAGREAMYHDLTGGADQQRYRITKEEAPIGISSLFPDYRYRFNGLETKSGDSFISELREFTEANDYLVLEGPLSQQYAEGFAKAVAMAALFMDSLELQQTKGAT